MQVGSLLSLPMRNLLSLPSFSNKSFHQWREKCTSKLLFRSSVSPSATADLRERPKAEPSSHGLFSDLYVTYKNEQKQLYPIDDNTVLLRGRQNM